MNKFDGYIDATQAPELQKCSTCGGIPITILKREKKMGGLTVEELYPTCESCCKKMGIKIPEFPAPNRKNTQTIKKFEESL